MSKVPAPVAPVSKQTLLSSSSSTTSLKGSPAPAAARITLNGVPITTATVPTPNTAPQWIPVLQCSGCGVRITGMRCAGVRSSRQQVEWEYKADSRRYVATVSSRTRVIPTPFTKKCGQRLEWDGMTQTLSCPAKCGSGQPLALRCTCMSQDTKTATTQVTAAYDKAIAVVASSAAATATAAAPSTTIAIDAPTPSLALPTSAPPVTVRCTPGSYWVNVSNETHDHTLDRQLTTLTSRLDTALANETSRVPQWRADGGGFSGCGTAHLRREQPPLATCTRCGHSVWSWYCVGERSVEGGTPHDVLHEPRLLQFNHAIKRMTGGIAYSCGSGCGRKGDGACWTTLSFACACNQSATQMAAHASPSGTRHDTQSWSPMVWLDNSERNAPVVDDY